jgi:hypothetical protein
MKRMGSLAKVPNYVIAFRNQDRHTTLCFVQYTFNSLASWQETKLEMTQGDVLVQKLSTWFTYEHDGVGTGEVERTPS